MSNIVPFVFRTCILVYVVMVLVGVAVAEPPRKNYSKADRLSPEDYLLKQQELALIRFEAEYQLWHRLPEKTKDAILSELWRTHKSNQQHLIAANSTIEQQKRANAEKIEETQKQLSALEKEKERDINEVYTDPALALRKDSYDFYRAWHESSQTISSKVSSGRRLTQNAELYAKGLEWAQNRAKAINAGYTPAEKAYQQELEDAESANRAAKGQQTRIRDNLDLSYIEQYEIQKVGLLELAREAEYVSKVNFQEIGKWSSKETAQTSPIHLTGYGVVLFFPITVGTRDKLRITAYSVNTKQPSCSVSNNVLAYRRYMIIKDPGDYYLKINAADTSEYEITAYACRL